MVHDKTDIDLLLTKEYAENNSSVVESEDVYIIAGSEDLLPHQLALLAYCGSSRIRTRVAENCATPTWLLYHLSQDEDPQVRISLAENHAVTLEILRALSRDKCDDVRYTLAENSQMPLEILEGLLDDANPYVASRSAHTLGRKLRASKGLKQNQYQIIPSRHLQVLENVS